ncbi:MAG: PadR family transcriptional regulator [bacterium]|nr:PadR family transcriptional regulator [bacterium]
MKINKELLKGTTTLLILQLLDEGDKYGYQLSKKLEERSGQLFQLKEGTLYPILHSLESMSMIEAYWEETESARKRKYYRITEAGRDELKERKKEWKVYAQGVKKVIQGGVRSESVCSGIS